MNYRIRCTVCGTADAFKPHFKIDTFIRCTVCGTADAFKPHFKIDTFISPCISEICIRRYTPGAPTSTCRPGYSEGGGSISEICIRRYTPDAPTSTCRPGYSEGGGKQI
ncbi:hypothetical protein QE152_g7928 [Popillia japonica]|uniref:Uncharacterized protein n=1 Tax=Popillia japonica TaxID=7064 RepID=A0AAW1MBU5_POPJA